MSKWNGVRYDFGDETAGPFDPGSDPENADEARQAAPGARGKRPGSPVAADLARRKRKPPSVSADRAAAWGAANPGGSPAGAPVQGPPASSTREFYDRQMAEQQRAREAGVARNGMSDLAARASQGADRADATVQAGAAQQAQEAQRRELLRRTLISRVQDMMLPFQRAGLPPIGGR